VAKQEEEEEINARPGLLAVDPNVAVVVAAVVAVDPNVRLPRDATALSQMTTIQFIATTKVINNA